MTTGIRFVVDSQHASNGVLVQVKAESQVDLLGNPRQQLKKVEKRHLSCAPRVILLAESGNHQLFHITGEITIAPRIQPGRISRSRAT